jgi:hypothetical protein
MSARRLMTMLFLASISTAAFAQNIQRLPEGGSDIAYLALAGISCIGAIVYRFRR